ncbi:MAG: LysR family transcriptional regulator [Candidatus Adiutrix sp.]|jgi:DNA-binding transcriptional LysR family regulator|nr:LysR family transcriptional regulator [Candidatus Adiutrix sp.]
MNLTEIAAFLHIARFRSLTKAADEMHLAQSTVSKRLQLLEENLGYSLIERGRGIKRIQLTPEGEEFLAIAERYQEVAHEAAQIGKTERRHNLAIGTVSSANMTIVPQLCKRLLAHDPPICFRVISLHSMEMYEEIEKRNIDVGFALVEQVHPSVIVMPCFAVPFVGIRLKRSGDASVVDVRSLDPGECIFVPWGTRYQTWHDYWFHAGKRPKATIDNPYILFDLLSTKKQWAVVPMAIANLLLSSDKFEIFKIDPQPPDRIFFKLTHKYPHGPTRNALEIFSNFLSEELATRYLGVYTEL